MTRRILESSQNLSPLASTFQPTVLRLSRADDAETLIDASVFAFFCWNLSLLLSSLRLDTRFLGPEGILKIRSWITGERIKVGIAVVGIGDHYNRIVHSGRKV